MLRKWSELGVLFNCLGLSTLGAAMTLEFMVLSGILTHGYFSGIEQNSAIVYSEVVLAAFGALYLLYLVWRFISSYI